MIVKKMNEGHSRISGQGLVNMMQAVMQPSSIVEESNESIFMMGQGDQPIVSQIQANQASVSDEAPFLLIDLRDKQEYDAWHIKEAFNFPLMMLN